MAARKRTTAREKYLAAVAAQEPPVRHIVKVVSPSAVVEHYVTAIAMDQYKVLMGCRCGMVVTAGGSSNTDAVFFSHIQGMNDAKESAS